MTARVVAAYDELEEAHQRFFTMVHADYPVGSDVRWARQRDNAGTVLKHGYRGKLEVRNSATGATYWIRPDEIVTASRTNPRRSAA